MTDTPNSDQAPAADPAPDLIGAVLAALADRTMPMLPIDPTAEEIDEFQRAMPYDLTRLEAVRVYHQAGVEAERARAAAELRDLHHVASDIEMYDDEGNEIDAAACAHCITLMGDHDDVPVPEAAMWPCATIRALDSAVTR